MKYMAFITAVLLIAAMLCSCGVTGTESKTPDVSNESEVSHIAESSEPAVDESSEDESSEAETGEVIYLVSKTIETSDFYTSVTTYEYNVSGLLIKKTKWLGNHAEVTHEYGYNENGVMVSDHYKSSTDEFTLIYEYDENGNIIKECEKENPGNYTLSEYDSEGKKAKVAGYENGELSYESVYSYSDGKIYVVSEGVNIGKQTSIFDAETNLLQETIIDDLHRFILYDEHGNVVMDCEEKGDMNVYCYEYTYEYSEDGRMLKRVDSKNTTVYKYDENGNLQSKITTDYNGRESYRFEYEYIAIRKNEDKE